MPHFTHELYALLLLFCGVGLWLRVRQRSKWFAWLQGCEIFSPEAIREWARRSQGMEASVRLAVICRGRIAGPELPIAPGSQQACAAFATKIVRIAQGKNRHLRQTVFEKAELHPFFLRDDAADTTIRIRPHAKARVPKNLLRSSIDSFVKTPPNGLDFPPEPNGRAIEGYRVTESVLPEGEALFVYGEAHDRQGELEISRPLRGGRLLLARLAPAEMRIRQHRLLREERHLTGILLLLSGWMALYPSLGRFFPVITHLPTGFPWYVAAVLVAAWAMLGSSSSSNGAPRMLRISATALAIVLGIAGWWGGTPPPREPAIPTTQTPQKASTPSEKPTPPRPARLTPEAKPVAPKSTTDIPSQRAHVPQSDLVLAHPELESEFFTAYDALHAQAKALKNLVALLTPPEDFVYPPAARKTYRAALANLAREKPEYAAYLQPASEAEDTVGVVDGLLGSRKGKLKIYESDRHLARMTGFPERELAAYRKGKGGYGRFQLLTGLEPLANAQWVHWYYALNGFQVETDRLFQNDQPSHAHQARLAFGEHAKRFNAAKRKLAAAMQRQLAAESDPVVKNQLITRIYIHRIIARRAGKVVGSSQARNGYPLTKQPKSYPKIARLARELGVEFNELAYIRLKGGLGHKLKPLMEEMTWLPNQAELYRLVTE